jgi:flagella basal body P-ring formation protein FlgA
MKLHRAAVWAALAVVAAGLHADAASALSPSAVAVIAPRALALKLSPTAHGRNGLLGELVEGPLPPALAAVVVKPGLSPGSDVTVDSALVALKLRQKGMQGWTLAAGNPRSVTLKVPSQALPGADIRRFAQQFLEQRLSGTAGASIEPRGSVPDLKLFDAEPRLKVRLPDGAALRGDLVLRVDVLQAGADGEDKLSATVPVGFLVRRHEGCLVVTKTIRKGDALGPENLTLIEADATFDADGIPDLGAVAGKVARTYVAAGKVLTPSMVDQPVAIQRGDVVRLMVRSGGVVLEATAKALRDARIGETLPLQVIDTNRPVQARCVEAGVAVRDAP